MVKKAKIIMDMVERTAKIERLIDKVGGRFFLTVLIQKRIKEINQGSNPLITEKYAYPVDTILEEIAQDKIRLVNLDEQEILVSTTVDKK